MRLKRGLVPVSALAMVLSAGVVSAHAGQDRDRDRRGERGPSGQARARQDDGRARGGEVRAERRNGRAPRGDVQAQRNDGVSGRAEMRAQRRDGREPRSEVRAQRNDGRVLGGEMRGQRRDGREPRGGVLAQRNGPEPRGDVYAQRNGRGPRGEVRAPRSDGRAWRGDGRAWQRDDRGWRDDRVWPSERRNGGFYGSPRSGSPRFGYPRRSPYRRYGPGAGLSVYFGIGSGYRYGAPYSGRVYGYSVPSRAYGVRRYYGDVRLEVRPRDAAVYVDGYYAGIVDDFDGVFQRLTLEAGPHLIEIELPGLETRAFDVLVDPTRTVEVHADLFLEQP